MMHKNGALALLLAFILSCSTAVAADKPCTLKKLTSVELQVDRTVWLPVSVHGTRAWMQLNTGSGRTLIFAGAADLFGLPIRPLPEGAPEFRLGASLVRKLVVIDSLQIGKIRFARGSKFLLDPLRETPLRYKGDPVLGELGMDVFAHVDFELDLAHRTLNLFSQDQCANNDAYWADTAAAVPMQTDAAGELHFPMELNGQRIEAVLSTGSPNSTLHTDVSKSVFDFDEHSPGNEVEDGKAFYRAMNLTTAGLRVINAKIELIDPEFGCKVKRLGRFDRTAEYRGCEGIYPLELGLSVLEKLHLYFATGKQVLYFTAAETSERSAPAPEPGDIPHLRSVAPPARDASAAAQK